MIAAVRWNARIETGDTPRVEELAAKHNCTVEVVIDEAAGVASVIVEGSKGAAKKLLDELGATDVVEER
jgi:hypothetical protein